VDWLARQITGKVPAVGRLGLGYFADEKGRIVTEMSIARLAEGEVLLITAATAQAHDREWLLKHLDPGLTLVEETDAWSTQILTGPAARAILSEVTKADLTKPWLSWQWATIGGAEVLLMRVSFAGELGWEIHSRTEDTPAVWDIVMRAGKGHGLRPFGMFALNSLRIEKGYRAWKGDLSTDYTILQGGLERFVDWAKDDFRGKAALAAEKQAGVTKRFVAPTADVGDCDPPYMSTLWQNGTVVGETTSAYWGHRVGGCVALGMLRADLAAPGTRLEIEVFGTRYPAVVQGDGAIWDPKNERIRA
jgi:dimethylglycine dehydrogenase